MELEIDRIKKLFQDIELKQTSFRGMTITDPEKFIRVSLENIRNNKQGSRVYEAAMHNLRWYYKTLT